LEVIAITQDDLYPWTTFQTSSYVGQQQKWPTLPGN
jgi:hypothetical protein